MEGTPMFKIGDLDFSKHITVPSYKVNTNRKYYEWIDANGESHRQLIRREIKGQFTMIFDTIVSLDEFLDTVESNVDENGGFNTVDIYVNDLHRTVNGVKVYLDYPDLTNEKPLFGVKIPNGFTVKITQK